MMTLSALEYTWDNTPYFTLEQERTSERHNEKPRGEKRAQNTKGHSPAPQEYPKVSPCHSSYNPTTDSVLALQNKKNGGEKKKEDPVEQEKRTEEQRKEVPWFGMLGFR